MYNDSVGMGALGDAAQNSATAATTAAALKSSYDAGKLAPLLLKAGVASSAIPTIGIVIGALAITAGFVAKAQAKAAAIKSQKAEIDKQNADLMAQSVELDNQVIEVNQKKDVINQQLSKLNGLGSLKTFLQKTFTPAKYAQSQLNDSVAKNQLLTANVNDKISYLEKSANELESLFNELTKGIFQSNVKKTILWIVGISSAVAIGFGIYYAVKKNR